MRESLERKTRICLKADHYSREYVVEDIIGYGATCIVYNAYTLDDFGLRHYVRIKECFPVDFAYEARNKHSIIWKDESAKQESAKKFEGVYRRNLALQQNYEFVNVTCKVVDALLQGNNTYYIVIESDRGVSFDKEVPEDLYSILKTIRALSNTIAKYHDIGFLHLDLKPQNFMVIPETSELVKLFDFDSLVSKDEINQKNISAISYSNEWAAPEVRAGKLQKIAETADVYSIGTVLFYALFGHPYRIQDKVNLGHFDYENCKVLVNVNPAIKRYLTTFLTKTLSPSIKRRYQNMHEVIDALKEMILIADPDKYYLCSKMPPEANYFVGRTEELTSIEHAFENYHTAVIYGIGGMGKSELAKQYLHYYKEKYDTVVWADCSDGIKAILDNNTFVISPNPPGNENGDEIITELSKCVSERTLIILDNIGTFEDESLMRLLTLNCKVLLTTRIVPVELFQKGQLIMVDTMSTSDLHDVFIYHYNRLITAEDHIIINQIINRLGNYTILIPITAKQMLVSSLSPAEMLRRIENQGLNLNLSEKVYHRKDGHIIYDKLYKHLSRLFKISELTDDELLILKVLSVMKGISLGRRTLAGWCGFHTKIFYEHREYLKYHKAFGEENKILTEEVDLEIVNQMIRKGWIYHDPLMDQVYTHDVIAELVQSETFISILNACDFRFLSSLEAICNDMAYYLKEEERINRSYDFGHIDGLTEYEASSYFELLYRVITNIDVKDGETRVFLLHLVGKINGYSPLDAEEMIRKLYHSNRSVFSPEGSEYWRILFTAALRSLKVWYSSESGLDYQPQTEAFRKKHIEALLPALNEIRDNRVCLKDPEYGKCAIEIYEMMFDYYWYDDEIDSLIWLYSPLIKYLEDGCDIYDDLLECLKLLLDCNNIFMSNRVQEIIDSMLLT